MHDKARHAQEVMLINTRMSRKRERGASRRNAWSHEFAESRKSGRSEWLVGAMRTCSVLLSTCCISLGGQYGWRVVFQWKAKNLREIRSWSSQNCEASFVGRGRVRGEILGSSYFTVWSEACTEACSGGVGPGGRAPSAAGEVVLSPWCRWHVDVYWVFRYCTRDNLFGKIVVTVNTLIPTSHQIPC